MYVYTYTHTQISFSGSSSGKESTCQCRRQKRGGFNPWVRKMPWSRKWYPTPVFLPGKILCLRSLVGYSTWDPKESHVTVDWAHTYEWLNHFAVHLNLTQHCTSPILKFFKKNFKKTEQFLRKTEICENSSAFSLRAVWEKATLQL